MMKKINEEDTKKKMNEEEHHTGTSRHQCTRHYTAQLEQQQHKKQPSALHGSQQSAHIRQHKTINLFKSSSSLFLPYIFRLQGPEDHHALIIQFNNLLSKSTSSSEFCFERKFAKESNGRKEFQGEKRQSTGICSSQGRCKEGGGTAVTGSEGGRQR